MTDKNGKVISKGDTVDVGAPNPKVDLHQNEFQGTVVELYSDGETVCVADQQGECFDVSANQVEVA